MSGFLQLLPYAEQESFYRSLSDHAKRAIRLRDDWLETVLPFEVDLIPWHEQGRFLCDAEIRPSQYPHYGACRYYIQDAGSLLPVTLLDPKPGEWICDLCAAPGGKASAIIERLGGTGLLLANEPIRSRTNSLRFMLARTGRANYVVTELDPDTLANRMSGHFDAVLVDAPCSGQMMVARDKRDQNAWSPKQIEHSAKRQSRILDSALRLLRPGGRIVYSTCTFSVEENETQLQRLLDRHKEGLKPFRSDRLSFWESSLQHGCYRLWPHRDGCAGGFAGGLILVRELESESNPDSMTRNQTSQSRPSKNRQEKRSIIHRKSLRQKTDWTAELASVGRLISLEAREWVGGYRFGTLDVWKLVESFPDIVEPPLGLLELGHRCEPTLALALLRADLFQAQTTVDLTADQTTEYRQGATLDVARESRSHHTTLRFDDHHRSKERWGQMRWNGSPLGWARYSQGKWKNHLPAWAR